MRIPIPAVCDNPLCRLAFFVPSFVDLPAGMSVRMNGVKIAPCPRCGGDASVFDGTYKAFDAAAELLSTIDLSVLDRAVTFLRTRQGSSEPTEIFKQNAKAEIPELSSLWDLIPQKRSEAYTLLALFFTVLTFIIAHVASAMKEKPKDGVIQVALPTEIVNALARPQPASRLDNHTAHSARKRRVKGRH